MSTPPRHVKIRIATLAKRAGFDMPVNTNVEFPIQGDPKIHHFLEKQNWNNPAVANYKITSLPTTFELFLWVMQEGFHVKVDSFFSDNKLSFGYNSSVLGSQEDNPQGRFEDYEDALEAGCERTILDNFKLKDF